MQIERAYKTELSPNTGQIDSLMRHAGSARFVWNWGLARRKAAYAETGKSPSAIDQHKELNALKKTELPWLYEVSKCAGQEALRDLDKAYANFYRRAKLKKQGKHSGKLGFPRFKKRKDGTGSFRLNGSIHVFGKSIQLPRIGTVSLKESGYIPTDAHILSATVSQRAGRWYVSVSVREEIPDPVPATGDPVGVDLGIKTFAVCSDGREFKPAKALARYQHRLKRAQQRLSRQAKGSNRRKKQVEKIARIHERIACVRSDSIHKMTTSVVAKTKPAEERPKTIVVEDLSVSGMLKNRKLARAISDSGWHEARRQFAYKGKWYGSDLKVAERFYPSSRLCSDCGQKNTALTLKDRSWTCQACGTIHDRDRNAASNLESLAGSSPDSINGAWRGRKTELCSAVSDEARTRHEVFAHA